MIEELKNHLNKTIENTRTTIAGVRTGRANPDLVSRIQVDYYGAAVPLQQVASVSIPEPTMIQLSVFDHQAVKEVEKAIQKSELGLTPNTEGSTIRLRLPELTEERRKELVKVIKKYVEEGKVSVRNIRRDYIDKVKAQEKSGDLSEDDVKRSQDDIQKVIDEFNKQLDVISEEKEKEILTV